MGNDGVFHSPLWFTQCKGRIDITGDGGTFAYEGKSRRAIVPPNKSLNRNAAAAEGQRCAAFYLEELKLKLQL